MAAGLKLAGATADSVEHPARALKLGHNLKYAADLKTSNDHIVGDLKGAETAQSFWNVMDRCWDRDVSSLACAVMAERTFKKQNE